MSLVTDLITQITSNSSTFTTVEHAWTMEPFEQPDINAPAIFIFTGKEQSKPSITDMCTVQECTKEVDIMYVCAVADVEAIQTEINSLVQGWQYNSNYLPLEHSRSEPQEIKGNYMWMLEIFTTTYQRRST